MSKNAGATRQKEQEKAKPDKEQPISNEDVIRAWKDPKFRNSLSEAVRAALPSHPAGAIELSDADLGSVTGGIAPTESWFCKIVIVTSKYTHTASCTSKQ